MTSIAAQEHLTYLISQGVPIFEAIKIVLEIQRHYNNVN